MPTDRTKPRAFFTPLRLLLFWFVALGLYFLTPISGYVRWLTLDVPTLNGLIDGHMRSVHGKTDFACLYTVECSSGEARLELRTEISGAELSAVKANVWRRLTENYCPGKTTNIGLEHSYMPNQFSDNWPSAPRDCFSFRGGGFGGATGFAAPCVFAPLGASKPCTRDLAYWTREDGIISGRIKH